eukprot:7379339-Prymnesium_polylepis.2
MFAVRPKQRHVKQRDANGPKQEPKYRHDLGAIVLSTVTRERQIILQISEHLATADFEATAQERLEDTSRNARHHEERESKRKRKCTVEASEDGATAASRSM